MLGAFGLRGMFVCDNHEKNYDLYYLGHVLFFDVTLNSVLYDGWGAPARLSSTMSINECRKG